jgi:phage baseplate assembly protein W
MTEKEDPLGKDIKLQFDQIGAADLSMTNRGDLETISGDENLSQAIISRLSTNKGELFDTGHPNYGSRLYEIIGEIFNESTRQKIKAIVRECLLQESRIRKIVGINVEADSHIPHQVNIEITILPVKSSTYLTLIYPIRLEG